MREPRGQDTLWVPIMRREPEPVGQDRAALSVQIDYFVKSRESLLGVSNPIIAALNSLLLPPKNIREPIRPMGQTV